MQRWSSKSMILGLILLGTAVVGGLAGSAVVRERLFLEPPASQADDRAQDDDWDVFAATVGDWRINGRLVERKGTSFSIELRVSDSEGNAMPDSAKISAFLEMPGVSAPAVNARVRRVAGLFMIEGRATASGLWRMSIVLPDSVLHVKLRLDS